MALSFVALLGGIGLRHAELAGPLDDLGKPIGIGRGAQIFLVGQLGKYLPGSVWAYVLQIELGRKAGLARARVFAATLFSLVVVVVAGADRRCGRRSHAHRRGSAPQLVAVALPDPAVRARDAASEDPHGHRAVRVQDPAPAPARPPVTLRVVAKSLGLAILSYVAYGVHLWLLADTWAGPHARPLPLCIGTMGIAMIAGLVVFLLPSGVGAREFVIIAALTPLVGIGPATAYAAVSRLMFIIADLLTAGAAAGLAVIARRRQGPYHGDPGID